MSVLISPWSADSAEHAVHSPSSTTGRLWNAAGHVSREEDVVTDTPSHVIGCIFYFGQCELIVCNTAHWLLLFGLILILDFANTYRRSRHAGDHSLWSHLAITNQYVTIRIKKRLKTNEDQIFILIYNVCCFWCRAVFVNVNCCDNRWQNIVDSNISTPVSSHQPSACSPPENQLWHLFFIRRNLHSSFHGRLTQVWIFSFTPLFFFVDLSLLSWK